MSEVAGRVAEWLGLEFSPQQVDQLQVYHDWVVTEAMKAGGLGPNEADRVWPRHIADSLSFGIALDRAESCIDVGSGVGLPGIPLAITYPEATFMLVDRSGSRCDLMRRAVAVVGVENCCVVHRELSAVHRAADAIVSRAAIPVDRMMIHVKRLLRPNGVAVLGLSRKNEPTSLPELPPRWSGRVVAVPADILDTTVYLLRIGAP